MRFAALLILLPLVVSASEVTRQTPDLKDVIRFYRLDSPQSKITKFELRTESPKYVALRLKARYGDLPSGEKTLVKSANAGTRFVVHLFLSPEKSAGRVPIEYSLTNATDGNAVSAAKTFVPSDKDGTYRGDIGARVPVVASFITEKGEYELVLEESESPIAE